MNEIPMELDQTAFQRVWERVMPQDRPDCPFTLEATPDLSPSPQPLIRSPLLPRPLQETPQSVPCLGEASMGELPRLEELAGEWAEARRTYRALARRMGSRGSFPPWPPKRTGSCVAFWPLIFSSRDGSMPQPSPAPRPFPRPGPWPFGRGFGENRKERRR